nr:zinc finger, CCHC-type [Tanacetum cinerariifolium]
MFGGLNSRELKKIIEGTKEETGDGLYVRVRSDHSEGHLKRVCQMKKSNGSIKEGGSYHMTPMRDFLYDFKIIDGGSVLLGDNKTCIINGTRKVKVYLHDGSSFIVEDARFKQVGYDVEIGVHRVHVDKRVWFEVELHGAQRNHKVEVFQVSNDDAVVAQRWSQDK